MRDILHVLLSLLLIDSIICQNRRLDMNEVMNKARFAGLQEKLIERSGSENMNMNYLGVIYIYIYIYIYNTS